MRIEIPCERCDRVETELVSAKVHFGSDEAGRRIHELTVYTLRCLNQECQHAFEKEVQAGEQLV